MVEGGAHMVSHRVRGTVQYGANLSRAAAGEDQIDDALLHGREIDSLPHNEFQINFFNLKLCSMPLLIIVRSRLAAQRSEYRPANALDVYPWPGPEPVPG